MNTPEPVVVGRGRYRLHPVRCGIHGCWQVEWQRDFCSLRRQILRCRDGVVMEFLSRPPWESSATLFAERQQAVAFAEMVLDARTEER